ncbi:MAG: ribonuclease HII [Chloroflexi bacterium]|nr:ribonuclease HII [Chloroflexota bacterium]
MGELVHEDTLIREGVLSFVGVDEVGRGAWAGPIVAGAAVLNPDVYADRSLLSAVDDSKRLTPGKREQLALQIVSVGTVALGWVDPSAIDTIGIAQATHQAMRSAIRALSAPSADALICGEGWFGRRVSGYPISPTFILVDGYRIAGTELPQQAIVRGDRSCLCIAAASIVAKVARDRFMTDIADRFPAFKFADHKGYGTLTHFRALRAHGLTPFHRRSFQPMKYLVGRNDWIGGLLAPPVDDRGPFRRTVELDFL